MTNAELAEAIKIAKYEAWNINERSNPVVKQQWIDHLGALMSIQLQRAASNYGGVK